MSWRWVSKESGSPQKDVRPPASTMAKGAPHGRSKRLLNGPPPCTGTMGKEAASAPYATPKKRARSSAPAHGWMKLIPTGLTTMPNTFPERQFRQHHQPQALFAVPHDDDSLRTGQAQMAPQDAAPPRRKPPRLFPHSRRGTHGPSALLTSSATRNMGKHSSPCSTRGAAAGNSGVLSAAT